MFNILNGLRIVECSAFVAAPMAGMLLAQHGANVIKVDRISGSLDRHRWPVTKEGESLFWAGMNKAKRSIAIDTSSEDGKRLLAQIICGSGPQEGVFLTNLRLSGALSYEELRRQRADLIDVRIRGDRKGNPHVDYTINPAVGFPLATGPENLRDPVGHVLPAWDCITGHQAALGILCAIQHRLKTGLGQSVELNLKDTALSMLGHLGIIGEVQINGSSREKIGNSLYGAYAQDFVTKDRERIIVVALTDGQWTALLRATSASAEISELESNLGVPLNTEENRFKFRREITEVLTSFFASRTSSEIGAILDRNGATWGAYRSFAQAVTEDPDCSEENPVFSRMQQPGIGTYLAPGSALKFAGMERFPPAPAPLLGSDTEEILAEAGLSALEIGRLHDRRVVASS